MISGWNFHHNLDDESMQLLVCHNPGSRRKYRTKSRERGRGGKGGARGERTALRHWAAVEFVAYATKVESKPRLGHHCLRSAVLASSLIIIIIYRNCIPYIQSAVPQDRVRLMNEHRAPVNFYAATCFHYRNRFISRFASKLSLACLTCFSRSLTVSIF